MGERGGRQAVVDDGFMTPVGQAGIKIFPGREVYNRLSSLLAERREEKWRARDFPSSITPSSLESYVSTAPRMGLGSHTVQRGQFVTGPGKKRPIKRNSAWTGRSLPLSLSRFFRLSWKRSLPL